MLCRVSGKAPMMKTIFKLLDMDSQGASVTLSASPEGLKFNGVGKSRVTFLNMDYPPAAFTKFECDSPTTFGIIPDDVSKVMTRVDKKSEVTISVDFENSRFVVSTDSKPPKQFRLDIVKGDSESKPVPTLEFPVTLNAKVSALEEVMKDVEVIGAPRLYFKTVNPGIQLAAGRFVANDRAKGIYEQTFLQGEGVDVTNSPSEPVRQGYSVDYIRSLNSVLATSEQVETIMIQYGSGIPMRINFDHNGGDVLFYLAPWKEQDVPAGVQQATEAE